MKPDLFLIIGLMVNVFFAVLYPSQIFGNERFDLTGETTNDLQQYLTVNGTSYLGTYNETTGTLNQNENMFTQLKDSVTSTEGDAGFFSGDLFGIFDWVKTGFELIKMALMFLIGFIWLLWNLTYPLNFLIGVPFSILYIYGIVGFMLGRS